MMSKRDTKGILLQTALEMLWSQSYGGVSVDDICRKANAKKGSFYHYFESKSELAKSALENLWDEMRPSLDQIFSPQTPPLQRIRNYAEASVSEQIRFRDEYGYIVGCPFTSIGSEQCSCDDGVSEKSKEILDRFSTYLRSAIKDAVEGGEIPPIDPMLAASRLLTYELGALSLARVSNSLEPMQDLPEVWMGILGSSRRNPADAR